MEFLHWIENKDHALALIFLLIVIGYIMVEAIRAWRRP